MPTKKTKGVEAPEQKAAPKKTRAKPAKPADDGDKAPPAKKLKKWTLVHDGPSTLAAVREAVVRSAIKANRPSRVSRMRDYKKPTYPWPHMIIEYLFADRYMRFPGIFLHIGKEGTGKSSFLHYMAGWMAMQNSPTHIIESENTAFAEEHACRLIARDKMFAKLVYDTINVSKVRTQKEFEDEIIRVALAMRGSGSTKAVPMDIPILIGLDSLSKLITEQQAEGLVQDNTDYMPEKGEAKIVGSDAPNPLKAANFWHTWCRKSATILDQENVLLLVTAHPSTKIDMSYAGTQAAQKTSDVNKELNSDAIPGSNALLSSTLYGITSAQLPGKVQRGTKGPVIGTKILWQCRKNRFGPQKTRSIEFIMMSEQISEYDTPSTYASPLRFDEAFCALLEKNHVMGVKCENKAQNRWTCRQLNKSLVSPEELYDAIASNPEVRAGVAKALFITGYGNLPEAQPQEATPPAEPEIKEEQTNADQDSGEEVGPCGDGEQE
jgi:hypothetical protein